MIIVDLIKEFVYQNNCTIKELADGTGLSCEKIRNILENDMIPIPEDANKIFKYFGVTLEEVLSLY